MKYLIPIKEKCICDVRGPRFENFDVFVSSLFMNGVMNK